MHTTNTKGKGGVHGDLINELKSLRKGGGLTSWKLNQAARIRSIIANRIGVDTDSPSLGHVRTYLLQEFTNLGESVEARATRNAFAIGWEHDPQNLVKRRAAFSKRLGRHPDTIEAYENEGIEELAFRLVSHDPVTGLSPKDGSIATVDGRQIRMAQAALNMVGQGLADMYGLGPQAPEILKSLGHGAAPYLDASVECVFLSSPKGPDWYTIKFRYRFKGKRNSYRVGLVTNSHDCEILMASGLVDDAFTLIDNPNIDNEVLRITSDSHFIFYDQATGSPHPLKFSEITAAARRELLSIIWQIDPDRCRIIEVAIPENGQRSGTLYEYRDSLDVTLDVPFAYWYAPGLMYLNTLTIDVTQFPSRDKLEFYIQPFLGPIMPGGMEPNSDTYSLTANSWIMQGHGVAVAWKQAA